MEVASPSRTGLALTSGGNVWSTSVTHSVSALNRSGLAAMQRPATEARCVQGGLLLDGVRTILGKVAVTGSLGRPSLQIAKRVLQAL